MIIDVASIDREHLPRHALITLVPPLAIFEKTLASNFDRNLVRGGPSLHPAFNANAECVGSFLVWEMLALSSVVIVGIVYDPRGLGFTRRSRPRALSNRGHSYTDDRLTELKTERVEQQLPMAGLCTSITIAQLLADRSRM
jgi:hypothetical protein